MTLDPKKTKPKPISYKTRIANTKLSLFGFETPEKKDKEAQE